MVHGLVLCIENLDRGAWGEQVQDIRVGKYNHQESIVVEKQPTFVLHSTMKHQGTPTINIIKQFFIFSVYQTHLLPTKLSNAYQAAVIKIRKYKEGDF